MRKLYFMKYENEKKKSEREEISLLRFSLDTLNRVSFLLDCRLYECTVDIL